jgi:hypothetical protein
MIPDSVSVRVKLRVLLDVRKHMTLNDEEFRQLLINVLREYMDDPSASWEDPDRFGAPSGTEAERGATGAPRVQLAPAALDDRLREEAVDEFIAAALRLVAEPAAESSSAH